MTPDPLVSIMMPVRNEADFIERSFGAVLRQDYPAHKMEILLVDGMSDDGTRQILQNYEKQYSNIRILDNPQKIVSTGLNRAIRESKGTIMVRVDGHCEIEPDYVRQCVNALKDLQWDVAGGTIETVGATPVAQAIALAMSSWFGVGGSAFRTVKGKETEVDTVPFPAYRRTLFDRVGFFDEEMVRNQDDEHNYRIRKAGGKILLTPKIRSQYYSRSSLTSLGKQYFQYGYWKVRVMQKHPRQMKPRHFVPALFIGVLVLSAAVSLWNPLGLRIFSLLVGFYLICNLAVSLSLALQKGLKLLWILPVVFAALHFSYGLGFLAGLCCFGFKKHA